MGIMRKALDNGKKLAKVSIKMMPKGKVGDVKIEEPEEIEDEEEMEVEETPVEEEDDEEIEEEVPEAPKEKASVGEIITYAKEIGYAVTDANGKPIECSDYAQAIIVSDIIKKQNETTTE